MRSSRDEIITSDQKLFSETLGKMTRDHFRPETVFRKMVSFAVEKKTEPASGLQKSLSVTFNE
jgi:hypothetical protein